jgi:4-hydroxy-tetrahydrodipicolinate reductase
MGRQVAQAVAAESDLQLVGLCDLREIPTDHLEAVAPDVALSSDLAGVIAASSPDVMVDFTDAAAGSPNILIAIDAGVSPVVGTTGFAPNAIDEIDARARAAGIGAFIAPNFALGAVMLMRLCETAAPFFEHVEIIEMHHDKKIDAPSGTAYQTARGIVDARGRPAAHVPTAKFTLEGVRGGDHEGVKIHSVRLPGLVAHQEVIFGDLGQTLTIRHDSTSRESFMPGVVLAIRKVRSLTGLVVGLDRLLFS